MANRKTTKVDLLLDVLADGQWHSAEELAVRVGWRFGATIKAARYKDYPIETERVGLQHRYRWLKG